MSSHHIVREKQEPALLILSLAQFTDEQLGQLLEWSPTVIAGSATVAEQLCVFDIKIDYVIADNADWDIPQSDIKIITANGKSEMINALSFLINNGYPAVNIIADRFAVADFEPYAAQINIVIFYNGQKIYAVVSGFRKWKPAGETLELFTDDDVQTTGLQRIAPQQYQTRADGFFSLQFKQPYVFIAEQA